VTLSRRETSERLSSRGLAPRRAFGQNFVVDANTVRRIARLARVGPGDHVIEIGAGLGALTRALVETGADVTAVEIDHGLAAVLDEELTPLGVRLVVGDALSLDWSEVLAPAARWSLVANLPYNVATPMVADLLDDVPAIERMLVMVQKEVGERMVAAAGTEAYGAISVKIAYWATAQLVGKVPPTVFLPQPKVDSVLVSLTRRPVPAVTSEVPADRLFAIVRAGFAQRRKMLRGSLSGVVETSDFEIAGVRPQARAEELDIDAWGRLARAVIERESGAP
jgi:16S rRNA (adenine1518-N6/adenine1519-N6)-dimethyltransferase